MNKKNILVVFGGRSPEYQVSLKSAFSIISSIDRRAYNIVMAGITRAGNWYYFTGNISRIPEDTWYSETDCQPAVLSHNPGDRSLLIVGNDGISKIEIHSVFPILHGSFGEDGTLQGLCELAGIPLVGCGTLASALSMDKNLAHKVVQTAGIAVPRSFTATADTPAAEIATEAEAIGYPLFVKPVRSGSSYGISKVLDRDCIFEAVNTALGYDSQVIVEEAIDGFEVGCAVMGNRELLTGEIDEIRLTHGFFDFKEKYTERIASQIIVPARISSEKSEELKNAAKTIYRVLGCRGFARVDMFLTPAGAVVFNEVNTIPGFTSHSRFPNMMKAAGLSFEQIVSYAIEFAFEN